MRRVRQTRVRISKVTHSSNSLTVLQQRWQSSNLIRCLQKGNQPREVMRGGRLSRGSHRIPLENISLGMQHLPHVIEALNKQIYITAHLLEGYNKLVPALEMCTNAYQQVHQRREEQKMELTRLTETTKGFDVRVREWETTYLAEIIDRLPMRGQPTTPASHGSPSPTLPAYTQTTVRPSQSATHEDSEDVTGVLNALEHKSLRTQCAKALAGTGSALRPFRS